MENLSELLSNLTPLQIFRILNVLVALFCAAMLFSMKTETDTKERPWTKYLGSALLLFVLQYVVYVSIKGLTAPGPGQPSSNDFVWAELFGIPINWFLLSAARTLLNRRRRLPDWFFVLVAGDVVAVLLGILYIPIDDNPAPLATLCRAWADSMTFISFMCFGYASFLNTNFYRDHSGVARGSIIGIIFYGGIHVISPFIPNIAYWGASDGMSAAVISGRLTTVLTLIAAALKPAILYSAFRITTLESNTLIELRKRVRRSVRERNVFFSRTGVLEAIVAAFRADEVRLYVIVPPGGDRPAGRRVHVYSGAARRPGEAEADEADPYEDADEADTPIRAALERMKGERRDEARRRRIMKRLGPVRRKLFQAAGIWTKLARFDGTQPIRYHGALVGCLTIEKKGSKRFTYSAERLCKILSEDISALVQFYRLQQSLQVLIEGLNKNLGAPPRVGPGEPAAPKPSVIVGGIEDVIKQVLSPLNADFVVSAGFGGARANGAAGAGAAVDGRDGEHVKYECFKDEAGGRLRVGEIHLLYQPKCDPADGPSLGYFRAYGEVVASIVTITYLSAVEQRFDRIIRRLSFELTKKQTLDTWFEKIQEAVHEADLNGVVLYHPQLRESRQLTRGNEAAANEPVCGALAEALPEPEKFLEPLAELRPRVVASGAGGLVVGMRLRDSVGGLFVGVRRAEFADELELNSPWRNFLMNLADVAGSSLERIILAGQIQKNQLERAEDMMVIDMAERVNYMTHELINRIESLNGNAALLNMGLEGVEIDDSAKQLLGGRVEEVRVEFQKLRSLVERLHRSALIPEHSGPCSFKKTLGHVVGMHEAGSNIEIKFEGVKLLPADGSDPRPLPDITIDCPESVVALTFNNLVRNSVASIERAKKRGDRAAGAREAMIRIRAEVREGEKFVNCFVNDTGAGVPADIKDSIFNLGVSATPGKGGWGLFYLRRTLVRNRGSVELVESGPGNTTFRVGLPTLSE